MAQKKKGFDILEQPRQKQVSVFWKGKLVTAYCYYDSIRKPFLFPVNTTTGITVTRGYPLIPAAGERTDHPHHTGVWMNYESVNGLDFWNNSTAIPVANRNHYGTIRHKELKTYRTGNKEASLNVTAEWITPEGGVLLDEITTYKFQIKDNDFYIDRITTLQARSIEVVFADVKDGFFAIRVARELEMPTQQSDVFIDTQGNKTSVPKINNEGVTGMYFTSEGKTGDSAWGTKGPWTVLQGKKGGQNITIAIFDHPSNPGYPAYRHARGYGLFAINPLGRKVFSNGNENLNMKIPPNGSVTFRYRLLVRSGPFLSAEKIKRISEEFQRR